MKLRITASLQSRFSYTAQPVLPQLLSQNGVTHLVSLYYVFETERRKQKNHVLFLEYAGDLLLR